MTNKIKVFVGFLALIALFSVYSSFHYLNDKTSPVAVISQQTPLPIPDADPDHDGLTNKEEAIWGTDPFNSDTDSDGFKDGEEVASGHNPLKPGPNDLLNDGNLTDKLSNLALSGLYEGSLKPNNPNYTKSSNDLTSAIADDAMLGLHGSVDINKLKITDTSRSNQEVYIEQLTPIFDNFLKNFGEELKNFGPNLNSIGATGFNNTGVIQFYKNEAQQFQDVFNRGSAIEVPKNWVREHGNFLQTVKSLELSSEAIANGHNDPIKAAAAFNIIGSVFDNLPNLVNPIANKIKDQNLKTASFLKDLPKSK